MIRLSAGTRLFSLDYFRKHNTENCKTSRINLPKKDDTYSCGECHDVCFSRRELLEHQLKAHPVTMAFLGISKEKLKLEILKTVNQSEKRKQQSKALMVKRRAGAAAKREDKAEQKKAPK